MSSEELKILLVEDSILTAEQVCDLIREVDASIVLSVATTENDAVAAVSEFAPDIVVLDLRLKQGSGFSVLRKLAPQEPKPSIIVLTNYALPNFREYAVLSGADYFLDKALEMDSLPAIIESCAHGVGRLH